MKTSKRYRFLVAGLGASVLFATVAQAADIGPYASPTPVETWTGFSVGVGGGVGFLNSDVNAKASRTDGVGCAAGSVDCPSGTVLREIDQNYSSTFSDLGGTGGFFTVQGAYDYQFAPRWVVAPSSMQIGPMSAVTQNRQEALTSRSPAITLGTAKTNLSARLLPAMEPSTQK